mmetsp:Transcript_19097/g.27517  ORF Transcript_19097/g.27517 Transcript_19097/m.27517 type:complete len:85 (+) Transcript_19097:214-468(+)
MEAFDQETIRLFFHDFCEKFAKEVYEVFVYHPTDAEQISDIVYFQTSGLSMSADVVYVNWAKCPFSFRSSCNGKEGCPTLPYEV